MSRDLHDSAFDAGTRVKLSLYRAYLREWLPVFLAPNTPNCDTVNIFDFFAGPGEDTEGVAGSPLIALEELLPYRDKIRSKNLAVNLHLNEFVPAKQEHLVRTVKTQAVDLPVEVKFSCLDFEEAFEQAHPRMGGAANLIFLDQYGVKHVSESVFRKIVSLRYTDFLFFVASSSLRRFCEHDAFRRYVQISREEIEKRDPNEIHRLVLDFYRSLLPAGRPYYLAPFSIRKGSNIYGLIFGSRSYLGIEKFLVSCWKQDPERGEANFDIDDDRIRPEQPYLFEELNRPKKRDMFDRDLSDKVRSGALRTDRDIYLFALRNGFLPKHAREVIVGLDKAGEISRKGLAISQTSMKRNRKPVRIKILDSVADSGESNEHFDND